MRRSGTPYTVRFCGRNPTPSRSPRSRDPRRLGWRCAWPRRGDWFSRASMPTTPSRPTGSSSSTGPIPTPSPRFWPPRLPCGSCGRYAHPVARSRSHRRRPSPPWVFRGASKEAPRPGVPTATRRATRTAGGLRTHARLSPPRRDDRRPDFLGRNAKSRRRPYADAPRWPRKAARARPPSKNARGFSEKGRKGSGTFLIPFVVSLIDANRALDRTLLRSETKRFLTPFREAGSFNARLDAIPVPATLGAECGRLPRVAPGA